MYNLEMKLVNCSWIRSNYPGNLARSPEGFLGIISSSFWDTGKKERYYW